MLRIAAAVLGLLALAAICSAAVPEPSFDFQLDDLHSRADVLMTELKDKPLVVHVWAPDCPMCQRNMPYFKSVAGKVDTKQVNVVACSMGERSATVDYVNKYKLDFKVLVKGGHRQDFISKTFTDDGWPTSYVFGPGGKLVGTCDEQGEKYEQRMLELIDKAVALMPKESKPEPHKVKHWY